MIDYVNRFSAPLHIIVGNGNQFHSQLFIDVCNLYKSKIYYTTTFHPKGNGYIKDAIASALENQSIYEWEGYLFFMTLAMNTSFYSSVQEIPFFLFFG